MKLTGSYPGDKTSSKRLRPHLSSLFCLSAAILLTGQTQAATLSWSGGSASSANWNDSGNWGFAGIPATGDTLIFPASQPRLVNTNNLAGLTLNQIRFVGAGGGYAIWGNAFTLTNGIPATNTAGVNTINNNITLATVNQTVEVGSGASLTLAGALSGGVGVTKTGAGTLTFSGSTANSYSGTTIVNGGLLQLGKTPIDGSINAGSLTISSATVREIVGYQLGSIPVTINTSGVLDLNGFFDTIGASLTLNGNSQIQTGAGTLYLLADSVITVTGGPSISGNLNIGSGTCTIQGSGYLYLYANVSGSANIVKNDSASMIINGASTFTGTFTANSSGYVWVLDDLGLGTTNGGTFINDSAFLAIGGGVNITNEALTMNSSYPTYAIDVTSGINSWKGPITLSQGTDVYVSSSSSLDIVGSITGAGGLTKLGAGALTFSGSTDNLYQGNTLVREGTLELNKSSFWWAIYAGTLTIGDGTGGVGADVVRYTSTGTDQIAGRPVVISGSGLLDLNGHSDGVGAITLQGGDITTGAGLLTTSGNMLVQASTQTAHISGRLQFSGSPRIVTVENGSVSYALDLNAVISDSGGGFNITNSTPMTKYVRLIGNNTFTGPLTIANVYVAAEANDSALGQTNGATIVLTNGVLWLTSSDITNESLTLNAGAQLVSQGSSSWAGPIILNGDAAIRGFSGAGPLALSGQITGTGNLTITADTDNWRLQLSGSQANNFVGDVFMRNGTLEFNKAAFDGAIPGDLQLGDATHSATNRYLHSNQVGNSRTVSLYNGSLMDLNSYVEGIGSLVLYGAKVTMGTGLLDMYSPGTITAVASASTTPEISGRLGLQTACTITADHDLTCTAQVYSAGALTKNGTRFLYLYGTNTYTGLTTVGAGWLAANNPLSLGGTASGTVVSNNASLVLYGGFGITNEALTLNGNGVSGWGALDAENAVTNIWAGPITVNATSTLAPYGSGSTLRIIGPITGSGGVTEFTSGGTNHVLTLEGTNANTYAGLTTVGTGTLLLNKSVNDGAVPGDLVLSGSSSVVRLANSEQIADSADVLVNSGGLFDFGTSAEYLDTLRGSGTVAFGTGGWIYLGLANGSSTFDGQFTGVGYAPGWTVGKTGTGTFTMNGNNTFSAGHIRIQNGKLQVNGAQPQSPVILDSSATFGGNGTVGTIVASGIVSPGTSPGVLTCSNATFTSTANYTVELNGPTPGTGYDQLVVRGTNNLGNATLNVTTAFSSPPGIGQQFVIINNDGIDPITGTFSGLANGATFALGDIGFRINYNGGDGNDVVLTVLDVPGASVTINATDSGWYDRTGLHNAGNNNYLAGDSSVATESYRNWFVFNLPAFSGDIVQAELLINCYTINSPNAQETYALRHVSTPIGTLVTGGSGLTNIYNDLGEGRVYSVRDVLLSERGEKAIVPLNVTFINDATAAMGGQIALGGAVASLDATNGNQELFGFSSGGGGAVQLRLTFGSSALVNANKTGWYNNSGFHNAANANYVVGREGVSFRDFFVFGLPTLSSQLLDAQLLINSYNNITPAGVLNYQLHDVTTPISTLTNNASGATDIFADLADGANYGGRDIYVSETGTKLSVPLSPAFLGAAKANSGGPIALGGAVNLPAGASIEYLFGNSLGNPTDVQLWLGLVPATVPSAHFLSGSPATVGNDIFQFVLAGTSGTTNEIQASTDFVNWDVVRTLYMTNATASFNYTNRALPDQWPTRFFRARRLQ